MPGSPHSMGRPRAADSRGPNGLWSERHNHPSTSPLPQGVHKTWTPLKTIQSLLLSSNDVHWRNCSYFQNPYYSSTSYGPRPSVESRALMHQGWRMQPRMTMPSPSPYPLGLAYSSHPPAPAPWISRMQSDDTESRQGQQTVGWIQILARRSENTGWRAADPPFSTVLMILKVHDTDVHVHPWRAWTTHTLGELTRARSAPTQTHQMIMKLSARSYKEVREVVGPTTTERAKGTLVVN